MISGRTLASLSPLLLLLGSSPVSASGIEVCPAAVQGAWTSQLPIGRLFATQILVREREEGVFTAELRSGDVTEEATVWLEGDRLRFHALGRSLAFAGTLSADGERLGGFLADSSRISRVELRRTAAPGDRRWVGSWSPLEGGEETARLDLYVGEDEEGGVGGYWFFRDQRLPGLWGWGTECSDGRLLVREKNLGLRFEGWLEGEGEGDHLAMTVTGADVSLPIVFSRVPDELAPARPDAPERPARPAAGADWAPRAPEPLDDGWTTAEPASAGIDAATIARLVDAIADGELELTHSVLVARRGRLAVEEYFHGFDHGTLHDLRSASKTLTSTLVGLAIGEGLLPGVEAPVLSFFPRYRVFDHWDPRKAEITIRDLLTMSSGLDANDADRSSVAAEGTYQSQTARPDWMKLALDAPMIDDPGHQPLYGGANPLLLGGVLAAAVGEGVEWFAHRTLFGPLGIERYSFFLDPTGHLYMGGGVYLRPRDLLKYGQLHLDGGVWQGQRILSEAWIRESWNRYGRLAPLDRNGHDYGYLWWHHSYPVCGRSIDTVEARGNGGQYLFVVPELDLVAVVTAGNFRTGKTRQPEAILRRFVLPAALGCPPEEGPPGSGDPAGGEP